MISSAHSNHAPKFYLHPFLFLAIAAAIVVRSCDANCLEGDIMYAEGDRIGHILGVECIDNSTYEGHASSCGPNGTIVEEDQIFTCSDYCVQCGPRNWGAALCLSTPTTDRDCGQPEYFDSNPIICPDGQDPIPDAFCGRGLGRADCANYEFCFVESAERFAVCCPYSENCCVPQAVDRSDMGSYCCSDGNWHALDSSGGGNCNGQGLTASVACPSFGNPYDDDLTEVLCCDPETGPGGCPDENGSFDRCWDEGGFCCSDGKWYANDGGGGNTCQDNQLGESQACAESGGDDAAPATDMATADPSSGGIVNVGRAATIFYFASCWVYLAVFACM